MTNQSVPLREQIKNLARNYFDREYDHTDLFLYAFADQLIKDCHIVKLADDQEPYWKDKGYRLDGVQVKE